MSDDSGREEDFRPGESIVERRIRLAMERGDFSNLPGEGEPIEGLDETYDALWWVKRWAEREGVTADKVHRLLAEHKRRD